VKKCHWLCKSLVLLGLGSFRLCAQSPATLETEFDTADARVMAEIKQHSETRPNIEYLSDLVGTRLTGSAELKRASEWTSDRFREYGLTNVHLESWTIAHSWARGTARAKIVRPTEHALVITSAGWAPSTPGLVRGSVVYVDVNQKEDLQKFTGKLKGAIVILREPETLWSPTQSAESFALKPLQEFPPPYRPASHVEVKTWQSIRDQFLKEQGVPAILRVSGNGRGPLQTDRRNDEGFEIGAIPTGFVTTTGYRVILRLLKRGPVQIEIEMTNSIGDKPVQVYNTVADLPGSEKPDEVVILGAHLDTSDLVAETIDASMGSISVLEAARALAKTGLKPKRTIRFILFTGGEQGLAGSTKYVAAHKDELAKVSAVLVHDAGAGRVLTIGLHGNYQAREVVDRVLEPLGDLHLLEPTMGWSFATDHAPFAAADVPAFFCIQDRVESSPTLNSQSDTFDGVLSDSLNQGAELLATWAYNTAQLPEMMPRRQLPKEEATLPKASSPDEPVSDPIAEMDANILAQVKSDQKELMANLEHLVDQIGPRLTGSSKLDEASHWSADLFRKYGLANVRLEPRTIATAWSRGTALARVIAPTEQTLTIASAGWSANTNGTVRANVVGIKARTAEDLQAFKGKLRGAIVLAGEPLDYDQPRNPMVTPYQEISIPVALPHMSGQSMNVYDLINLDTAQMAFFKDQGAAAVLFPSDKSYGLLDVSTETRREYRVGSYPLAYATQESYRLLWRLLKKGPVQAEIEIHNTFSDKPVEVYNTIAEIPGTEKPDEVVIIGAHLDSWDLGTGATDNATGAVAVLEAAYALQRLGVRPKRTIRFVLFTSEEQGELGSQAYVDAHKQELAKISGILVLDWGTGRVLTIGMMRNYAARETMDRVVYPLSKIGFMEPTLREEGGSDHVPFDEEGVPAFWCVQEPADYALTHHSQADTFDRVLPDDVTEGSQVLAVWAYNVAQLPNLLPRKKSPVRAQPDKQP